MSAEKKRVLLLSPFFFPEQISTGKYNYFLAKGLVDKGYDVTVICSSPLYPSWIPTPSNEQIPGVRILRGGEGLRYPSSAILRRALLEVWYAFHVFRSLRRSDVTYDYVLPIFPPSLFFIFAFMLLRRNNEALIGIVHDLQGVYASRKGGLVSRLVNYAVHAVESKCFNMCSKLVLLSHSMAKRAVLDYEIPASKVRVCYPFVALDEGAAGGDELSEVLRDDVINVVYSGALGEKQNPDGLFDFMTALSRKNMAVRCHVFSEGPIFDALRRRQDSSGSVDISFHPLVPAEQLDELYRRSTIQIIPQAEGTSDGSLPSKMPNLIARGVPIFAICEAESEVALLVNEIGAGVVADTWDIASAVDLMNDKISLLIDEPRVSRCNRQKEVVIGKFNIDNVINVLGEA